MKSNREKWYHTEVVIGSITQSSGFFDDDPGEFKQSGSLYGDVQPYNGSLAEKEYGQVGQVNLRLFCPYLPELVVMGKIAKIGAKCYTITYAEHWEKGSMALLKEKK